MAIPTSKSTLKEHCLRALGKPVIDINVDPDQCDDRIDDALQYFAEYHMDGVERMYLKYKMTSDQITRGATNSTTNVTDTVDNSGGAYSWLEQKVWIPLPSPVISVLRIFPLSDQVTSSMFDLKYQLRLNDLYDFSSTSIIHYEMTMKHLDFIDHVLTGEVPIRHNQHQNRLYLDMDFQTDISANEYIIIECYRKLDPATYSDIWNDIFLKKYATQLIKRQWGANLSKFQGVQMLGGVTMNGEQIYTQAQEELNKLEEQIQLAFELPPTYMVG